MTDERLRKSLREAAGGGPDAEARLLHERLRAGTLTRERLELAAHLDHEPARRVLDDPLPPLADSRQWFAELARWGQGPWLRGVIACFELANAELEDAAVLPLATAGLAALVEFAERPRPDRAHAIVKATVSGHLVAGHLHSLGRLLGRWKPHLPAVEILTGPESQTRPTVRALTDARALARHAVRGEEGVVLLDSCGPQKITVIRELRAATGLGLREAKLLADRAPGALVSAFDLASDGDDHAAARAAVTASVLAWALGTA